MTNMENEGAWPEYQVGPRDCIFALGVVSVNYVQFEWSFRAVLATVCSLTPDFSDKIFAKTNNTIRFQLIKERLDEWNWPPEAKSLVEHFIRGASAVIQNRNTLMHSEIHRGAETKILLYKQTKKGET